MIQSMTGFGSGRRESAVGTVAVEVKTVNHKYLDVHIRLPAEYQSMEAAIRKKVSSWLRRGRVDLTVGIEPAERRVSVQADEALIDAYVDLVRSLHRRFPISGDVTTEMILQLPGAISASRPETSEEEKEALLGQVVDTVDQALSGLRDMRRAEGKALLRDLEARISTIRSRLAQIRDGAATLVAHYRDRLTSRLAELAPQADLDGNRIEIEALIYADKSDITEEVTRLESHLAQFEATVGKEGEAGKRLDFLLQEMNREVTTILSKTSGLNQSGSVIGASAIDIKVEIDKLREQVQNVE